VAEALSLLAGKEQSRVCAGGTDLLPRLRTSELAASELVLCGGLAELRRVRRSDEVLVVGAALTYRELAASEPLARHFPALRALVAGLANPRVRNRGTLGGHVCAARSRYDVLTLLVALGARVRIASGSGTRTTEVGSLALADHHTSLATGELVTELELPLPATHTRVAFERVGTSQGPVVNVAAVVGPEAATVVVGAAGPTPSVIDAADALGGDFDPVATRAAEAARTGHAGLASPWYRSEMAAVLTRRALDRLLAAEASA
jgi:carbon-monoxide dehydrogenase medium subunit